MHPRHRKRFRYFARIHFWLIFFTFVSYLGFGFSLGPDFFRYDVLKKIHILADEIFVVTATVLGPPAQPGVVATPTCLSGAPRITLDWSDDAATTTWDVARDGLSLTTGLVASQYIDTAVMANTTYSYVVTAFGPMGPGVSVSDPVSVATLDCPSVASMTVLTQTLGGINIETDRTNIILSNRQPELTGTTNTPNASIDISVDAGAISALISANGAGYYSWIPPTPLESGSHTIVVTATDPNDAGRIATDTITFTIPPDVIANPSGGDNDKKSGTSHTAGRTTPVSVEPITKIDFSVDVNNRAQFLFQGDDINVGVYSVEKPFPIGTLFRIFVVDAFGKEVLRLPETGIEIAGQTEAHILKKIPLIFDPGAYRVRVDAYLNGRIVSREAALTIRAWPLIQFGGGITVTYPEVASYLGTLLFILLSLFLFLLLLFSREYWLYMHRLRHVTEHSFERLSLIGKRKGVAK